MSRKNKIPDFKTIEEAREFWDTHSLADFTDEVEVANDVQFTKRNNLLIPLDLEKEDLKRLRIIAGQKGLRLNDLVTRWIKEQLRSI
ncbi:CopG family antitoxin [Desulfoscipio sp. XC116]|uniref:CopG family antitoxin n=1 Tax=Desulfoscipio sp. XC116 TaxID=3144975 RepID=UPI00325B5480